MNNIDKLLAEKNELEAQFKAKEKALAEELDSLGLSLRLKWTRKVPKTSGCYLFRYMPTSKKASGEWKKGTCVIGNNGQVRACNDSEVYSNITMDSLAASDWQFAGPIDEPSSVDVEVEEPKSRRKVTVP